MGPAPAVNGHTASTNGHMDNDGPAPKRARLSLGLQAAHNVCLVLDYGSQYTQLIARRVRDQDVCSLLLPGDATLVSNSKQAASCACA